METVGEIAYSDAERVRRLNGSEGSPHIGGDAHWTPNEAAVAHLLAAAELLSSESVLPYAADVAPFLDYVRAGQQNDHTAEG